MIVQLTIVFLTGYLLGCIPFALLIGRLKGMDIRDLGSKNIGATNLLRLAGKGPGFLALFLDISKGCVAVALTIWLGPRLADLGISAGAAQLGGGQDLATLLAIAAGVGAMLGHCFNVFLRFSGGKAVAVSTGVFIALAGYHMLFAFVSFVVVVAISRYVSLGSILAAMLLTVALFVFPVNGNYYTSLLSLIGAVLIIAKHKANIQRLIKGEENKFSLRGKGKTAI